MNNYLLILEESLQKKIDVLEEISSYNEEQYKVFSENMPDLESFDETIERKEELIQKLTQLDEGFESLYAKIAEQLSENREQYAEQIRLLQGLITQITDMSVKIQAQEARNKALIEGFFSKKRREVGDGRRSVHAAMSYYQTQANSQFIPPQFMDSKN